MFTKGKLACECCPTHCGALRKSPSQSPTCKPWVQLAAQARVQRTHRAAQLRNTALRLAVASAVCDHREGMTTACWSKPYSKPHLQHQDRKAGGAAVFDAADTQNTPPRTPQQFGKNKQQQTMRDSHPGARASPSCVPCSNTCCAGLHLDYCVNNTVQHPTP